jgi:Fic family protein
MFAPRFQITAAASKALMEIEAARQAVTHLPVDVAMLASLRETARLAAAHYSTQIEGNRLTQAEVKDAVAGAHFPGRERDEREARNYWRALEEVERLAVPEKAIAEEDIRRLHGLVMEGKAAPTPYRDAQNVIRDSGSRRIVYMPPEASDVPALMADLVAWIAACAASRELPAPIIAALAHYQFATIHPYYDGNGRTARLLATLILHRTGYGLKGIYALEEYYARDLGAYYDALAVGPSHNYYLGRAGADAGGFVDYFCRGMADAFAAVRAQAERASARGGRDASALLRGLDPKQRRVVEVFRSRDAATTADIAAALGFARKTASILCREWAKNGFLDVHDPSKKARTYRLGAGYGKLV